MRIECLVIVAFCIALASCNRDSGFRSDSSESQEIKVNVSGIMEVGTKSEAENEEKDSLLTEVCLGAIDETDTLVLTTTVGDYDDLPLELVGQTKGPVNTTAVLNQNGRSFVMNAWLGETNRYKNDDGNGRTYEQGGSSGRVNYEADKENYHFIDNAGVSYSSGEWTVSGGQNWRNGVPTTFWSYYPSTNSLISWAWPEKKASDDAQQKVGFTYKLPVPSSADATDAAVALQDVIFAYNYQSATFGEDPTKKDFGKLVSGSDVVNIKFRHLLAAIRFDISKVKNAEVTIDEVFFEGVVSEGKCSLTGDRSSGAMTIAWTPDYSKKANLKQAFSSDDFNGDGLVKDDGGHTIKNALQIDGSKYFFFIPQAVKGKDIVLGVTYTKSDGVTRTVRTVLDHNPGQSSDIPWEAGKIYTYKLSTAADRIDVDVQDDVEGFNKTNLAITNTGNTPAYIRAFLIGAYCENDKSKTDQVAGEGAIVYAWDPGDPVLGEFIDLPGSDWVEGQDGFWYYTKAVEPDAQTSQLFKEYKAYFMPPVGDSHLEISIAAQAVAYDDEKARIIAAWNVDEIKQVKDSTKMISDALKLRQ